MSIDMKYLQFLAHIFLFTKCLSVALTDYPHCPPKTDVTQDL